MKYQTLKKCPWCQEKPDLRSGDIGTRGGRTTLYSTVLCTNNECQERPIVHHPFGSVEGAIKDWNDLTIKDSNYKRKTAMRSLPNY